MSSVWVFFPTLEHKAFKMHSKVGDLCAQLQHDNSAKLVVTETAVLCTRNIVTYIL